jgi:hypothetical protein
LLRNKPIVIKKILSAGFDVWYLDADIAVIEDFRDRALIYTKEPYQADIILAVSPDKPINPTETVLKAPPISSAIMFFKSNAKSIRFLNDVIRRLESNGKMTEKEAIIEQASLLGGNVAFTGIGAPRKDEYPGSNDMGEGSTGMGGESDHRMSEGTASRPTENYIYKLLSTFSQTVPRIHFFDSLEFADAQIVIKNPKSIPITFHGHRIIHYDASALKSVLKETLQKAGFWVYQEGKCISN